jgi:hypothetical protein
MVEVEGTKSKFKLVLTFDGVVVTKLDDETKFEGAELTKLLAEGLEVVFAPEERLTDSNRMITLLQSSS